MKVLLTGATGFLGSHLAKRLLVEGHEVAAFRRSSSSLERLGSLAKDIAWYHLESDNISLPFEKHGGIEVVIHVATCYGRKGEPLTAIFEANTAFPLHLLHTASRYMAATFLNSDTALNPRINPYALSKRHLADWGRMITELTQLRFINIRLEHIYGAGDDASKFTTQIVRQSLQNFPVIPLTPGEQLRDFIYIEDAVDAYLTLLEKQAEFPESYVEVGLGSGHPVSIREFAETVRTMCGSRSRLDFGAKPYRRHETMCSETDISFLNAIGWSPRFTLEHGLKIMIEEERKAVIPY